MSRAEALRGVDYRMRGLLARAEPPLAGVPIPAPDVPAAVLPPTELSNRVCHAMRLTIPPGLDVFALFGADWAAAGFQPRSLPAPDGPVLAAGDPQGFVLVLWQRADQVELCVISPRITPAGRVAFVGGIAAGAAIGLVGPCFSLLAFHSFGDRAFLAFLPIVLLVGGGLLIPAGTRRFGLGLLIGGAATGIVTAGVCAAMI